MAISSLAVMNTERSLSYESSLLSPPWIHSSALPNLLAPQKNINSNLQPRQSASLIWLAMWSTLWANIVNPFSGITRTAAGFSFVEVLRDKRVYPITEQKWRVWENKKRSWRENKTQSMTNDSTSENYIYLAGKKSPSDGEKESLSLIIPCECVFLQNSYKKDDFSERHSPIRWWTVS